MRANVIEMRCLGCGYDLRGQIEHRCPECARGFDPRDARTYANGRLRYRSILIESIVGFTLLMIAPWPLSLIENNWVRYDAILLTMLLGWIVSIHSLIRCRMAIRTCWVRTMTLTASQIIALISIVLPILAIGYGFWQILNS